ncbi:MAG: hypothetical protein ACI4MQ_01280 [Candidatus Coproplasma sp.]
MKTKTSKLIAAISAIALLGSVIGVGAYAIDKTYNNFGFKGVYSLNAFAAATESYTTTALGQTIDATNTLTITSTDGVYTLYLTIVDSSDMATLNNIQVGYNIGDNYYNGVSVGLSCILYSSLTIKTSDSTTETIEASSYKMTNAINSFTDAVPYFVIAEVQTQTVGANTATLTITGSPWTTFDKAGSPTNSLFSVTGGGVKTGLSLEYNGNTLNYGFKLNSSGVIDFASSLSVASTVTLGFADSENKAIGVWESSVTEFTTDTATAYATIDSTNVVTLSLPANNVGETYVIKSTNGESLLFYIEINNQHTDHIYSLSKLTAPTAVEEGSAELTCAVGGETKVVTLPVTGDESYTIGDPEITNDGHDISTPYTCTIEGVEITFNVETYNHTYDATPISVDGWEWSKDSDGKCTAKAEVTYKCSVCEVEMTQIKTAIVTDNGDGTYTGTVTINGNDYTNSWNPVSTVTDVLTIYDDDTNGHSINYTSELGYFTVDSNNTKFKYAKVTNLGGSQIVASGDGVDLKITCNASAKSVTVKIKLGLGNESSFSTASNATVTYSDGSTGTIGGTNIIDEYEFTLTSGQSVTITADNRMAILGATATVTPA